MNSTELRMVEVLKALHDDFGAISVRAEFEAEGTRIEELLRLKEISMKAGLGLTLKIGGCESIRDMLEARCVGVSYLVAPMIESPYALQKYLHAVTSIFPIEEREYIEILCNIETGTAVDCFDEILAIPEIHHLNGIVIERVDLCYSMDLDQNNVNDPHINTIVSDTIIKAKSKNLGCTVGGALSAQSLPFFRDMTNATLDRIETRKVCFHCPTMLAHETPEKGIFKALGFELLWLRNKLNFFRSVSGREKERMDLIEHRYMHEIDALL
jgi:4-hydroxy-2-oxoheptanedioate aldolase